jgi:hypothetical protein
MTEPCVCTHAEDEHVPTWGCVADTQPASGYPRPCMCAGYEAEDLDPPF